MARPCRDAPISEGNISSEAHEHRMDIHKSRECHDKDDDYSHATSIYSTSQLGRGKRKKNPKQGNDDDFSSKKVVDRPGDKRRSKSVGHQQIPNSQGLDGQAKHPL